MKLLVFADGNYGIVKAGARLKRQADESGLFEDGIEIWNLKRMASEMPGAFERHLPFLHMTPRGLGNWLWKPLVLNHAIQNTTNNKVICMLDAGCQLNLTPSSIARFEEYVEISKSDGGLFMQLQPGAFGFQDVSELAWTKRETLDFLKPDTKQTTSGQVQSGIIIITANEERSAFTKKWVDVCTMEEYRYLKDPCSEDNQYPEFIGHRWEQSILSILVKQTSMALIADETYWAPNWEDGAGFPIWSMRNRSGGDAFRRNIRDRAKLAAAKMSRTAPFEAQHRKRMFKTLNSFVESIEFD